MCLQDIAPREQRQDGERSFAVADELRIGDDLDAAGEKGAWYLGPVTNA